MSSVKQEQSLDQTQQHESETPQSKPSTTDRVVDSKYYYIFEKIYFRVPQSLCCHRKFSNLKTNKD